MSKSLAFYFDFVSPYSYLAMTQLPELVAKQGADLVFKPLLLGALHQAQDMPSPAFIPNKAKWIYKDCHLWAKHLNVPLIWPKQFPFNTMFILRVCLYLQQSNPSKVAEFVEQTFNAIWQQGLDVNDESSVQAHLVSLGLDVDEVQQGCQQQSVKDALKQSVSDAHGLGMFGAPAFKVNDDVFFGQDRLIFVEQALADIQE
ncbi:2-hydroxychromene-2-carboxylate isomerase [Oceaniserpentilla sp. 4NH20-0058]|uniref:2-hydroxychromene-2-carboxylate isomerase n=1 Tax=Oceaniserpentilla sp. 4NH20-0058 TaxID=3127660 RepID=UPI00310786A0